jgi:vacuolar-type H+-ATPase subunit E/Vma4
LGGDGVHAVGRRAGEDLVDARSAEATEEGVDGFIRSYADEEIGRGEVAGGVVVGVAEGTE